MPPEYASSEPQVSAVETVSAPTGSVDNSPVNPPATELATDSHNSAVSSEEASQKGSEAESSRTEHAAQATETAQSEPEFQATPETPDENSAPAMEQLIEQYATPQPASSGGEIFEGRIVAVNNLGLVVDVGGKFEGLVPAQEFVDTGGIHFQPGDLIEVERLDEQKEGYVLLSHTRAHRRAVWQRIEDSYKNGATLKGTVADRIKGGLVVDVGLRAFLPASQLDLRPTHDLESWKDREIEVRVLKLNRKRGNVVVSRRAILEEAQKKQRQALADSLTEGTIITGKVKNITDYGVFVDLGGIDGLLHVSDLVWGRITHPSEAVKQGDEIQVQILKFDREKMRISLGRKQLIPDPWAAVPERFPAGTQLRGKVMAITDYGAFVQIDEGIEGLVHVSEMSWSKRVKHPSKIVKQGDEVDVVVLEVNTDQRRISLGMKQLQPDPWSVVAEKYPVDTVITGRVRNLAEFGAFIELEDGIDGLIHISDFSWKERIKHPSEKVKKGDEVQAKVLRIDSEHRRLSLGIKQLNDIWANWFAAHKLNEIVRGKVVRNAAFGAFVELADGVEGLCHISEIQSRRGKNESAERNKSKAAERPALTEGQEYDFKVIRLDPAQRKISLSYRAAQKQAERQEIAAFRSSKSSPTATIGDAILAKRQAN